MFNGLEKELRGQGKGDLADAVKALHRLNGSDIPLPGKEGGINHVQLDAEWLVREQRAWGIKNRKDLPQPPSKLLEVLEIAENNGYTFEPHFLPKRTFTRESSPWPGAGVRPKPWYWDKIKDRSVSADATTLPGKWVLIEGMPKPDYTNGKQLHAHDPLGPILAESRESGAIKVPDNTRHIPKTSRFGVSWDEAHTVVPFALATILHVGPERIHFPREIEFNCIGNLYHPEWGRTNTWEWFEDTFAGDSRLIGGLSVGGGLADVSYLGPDRRNDAVAFRLLVDFPQNA